MGNHKNLKTHKSCVGMGGKCFCVFHGLEIIDAAGFPPCGTDLVHHSHRAYQILPEIAASMEAYTFGIWSEVFLLITWKPDGTRLPGNLGSPRQLAAHSAQLKPL
ncbi:MAG: hypothetical protein F6K64_24750 [Moorea sp. SIO3A2]|nr:hypothetical protein [Moorena sp. SIO3A2]